MTSIACTGRCSTRTPPSGARVEWTTVDLAPWQREERAPRRLLLAGDGLEARLPAPEVRLVAHEEPEHHVDPRVLACHCVGLLHVERLLGPADAEARLVVWRVRLVAVLRDPEMLRPVE